MSIEWYVETYFGWYVCAVSHHPQPCHSSQAILISHRAWQQLSGANVMTYYVVYVFQMAGLTGNINLISSGVQYALFIIFTTVMFFFIDKTGRRPLLIYGAIGMGICQFVVGGLMGKYGKLVPGMFSPPPFFPSSLCSLCSPSNTTKH